MNRLQYAETYKNGSLFAKYDARGADGHANTNSDISPSMVLGGGLATVTILFFSGAFPASCCSAGTRTGWIVVLLGADCTGSLDFDAPQPIAVVFLQPTNSWGFAFSCSGRAGGLQHKNPQGTKSDRVVRLNCHMKVYGPFFPELDQPDGQRSGPHQGDSSRPAAVGRGRCGQIDREASRIRRRLVCRVRQGGFSLVGRAASHNRVGPGQGAQILTMRHEETDL